MPPTNVTTDGDVPPVPAPPTKGGAGAGVAVDPPAPPAPSSTDCDKAKKEGETSSENMTSADYYFSSYSHFGIHEEMLKDEVRTKSYMHAILRNKHLFAGKVVLDVGCGTGILSMFAAKAGARKVIGVDCSTIIDQAREIVALNGFADTITLIKGKVEEIELPVQQVDIIISEWMGYFLLYESMLDTVLYARDKWLVPGGVIMPDKATLHVAAIEDEDYKNEKLGFWQDVYGFDMSPIRSLAMLEPLVDTVEAKSVVTNAAPILSLDLLTCTKEDLSFKSEFCVAARRNDYVHAFVAFFECAFTQLHKPVSFSTGPYSKYTHWKQTVLYLEQDLTICANEEIRGWLECRPNGRNPRDLDITLRVDMDGQRTQAHFTQEFKLR